MPEPARAADIRKQRVNKGLCPECGEEAAPYRLCGKHRFIARLRRQLHKARDDRARRMPILLTQVQAAAELGVSRDVLRRLLDSGEIEKGALCPCN